MPLYQIQCPKCQTEDTIWRKVEDRNNIPVCTCGSAFERIISSPMVLTDIQPYVSPATGRLINSRTQMREDLERSGHIINEPGLKQDIVRNKESAKEKAFAPVAAGVDAVVTQLVNNRQLES